MTPASTDATSPPPANQLLLFVGPGLHPAPELAAALARAGWRCLWLAHVEAALHAAAHACFDAVVVQAESCGGPPGRQLENLRAALDCPLLVAADVVDEIDEIIALEMGADGYLAGALAARRLRAHLGALQRRHAAGGTDRAGRRPVLLAGWTLDADAQRLACDGRQVPLTGVQASLLGVLAAEAGRVVSRDVLAQAVGPQKGLHARSVDVYIARLRRRLREQRVDGIAIEGVRGRGYALNLAPPRAAGPGLAPWLTRVPAVAGAVPVRWAASAD
jgi:DNA-binding response OmpR family regulator